MRGLSPTQDRALDVGSQQGEAQQTALVRRLWRRGDDRQSSSVPGDHLVRPAECPDQHRVRPPAVPGTNLDAVPSTGAVSLMITRPLQAETSYH